MAPPCDDICLRSFLPTLEWFLLCKRSARSIVFQTSAPNCMTPSTFPGHFPYMVKGLTTLSLYSGGCRPTIRAMVITSAGLSRYLSLESRKALQALSRSKTLFRSPWTTFTHSSAVLALPMVVALAIADSTTKGSVSSCLRHSACAAKATLKSSSSISSTAKCRRDREDLTNNSSNCDMVRQYLRTVCPALRGCNDPLYSFYCP